MKKFKKAILLMLCLGVIVSATACGGNANDDGANKTPTDQNDTNNDVTDGTDKKDNINDGGVINDMGNTAGDVIDDVGEGVKDMTDDMTGNGNNR
jgi:hypothetical protein